MILWRKGRIAVMFMPARILIGLNIGPVYLTAFVFPAIGIRWKHQGAGEAIVQAWRRLTQCRMQAEAFGQPWQCAGRIWHRGPHYTAGASSRRKQAQECPGCHDTYADLAAHLAENVKGCHRASSRRSQ